MMKNIDSTRMIENPRSRSISPGITSKTLSLKMVKFYVFSCSLALAALLASLSPAFGEAAHWTDARFADRLHRQMDIEIGLEHPLWMDHPLLSFGEESEFCASKVSPSVGESRVDTQCPTETAFASKGRNPALSQLEREIAISLCEIHHIEYEQAILDPVFPQETVAQPTSGVVFIEGLRLLEESWQHCRGIWLVRRPGHQAWLARIEREIREWSILDVTLASLVDSDAWIEPGRSFESNSRSEGRSVAPLAPTPMDSAPESATPAARPLEPALYNEVFSWFQAIQADAAIADRLRCEFEATVHATKSWGAAELRRLQARVNRWMTLPTEGSLGMEADSEPLQPIPTASYVGLRPFLEQLTDWTCRQWNRAGEKAQGLAGQAVRVTTQQNSAIERLVLEQFDAILR
jgi:hypothetical protein